MSTNLMAKAKAKNGKRKERHKRHSILDLLNYKNITDDDNHFIVLKDGTYCNFLQVPGVGLDSFPGNKYGEITDGFTHFLRQYVYDLTFLTTQFPASTQEQQIYWNRRLFKVQTKIQESHDSNQRKQLRTKERYIKQSLRVVKNVEQQLENQEYICFVFAKTKRDLLSRCTDVKHYGEQYLSFNDIDLKRKKQLLFKINNMNTPLNG